MLLMLCGMRCVLCVVCCGMCAVCTVMYSEGVVLGTMDIVVFGA